jgi:hypothetical protein
LDSFVEDRTDYSTTYDNAAGRDGFFSFGWTALRHSVFDGLVGIGLLLGAVFMHRYWFTGAGAGGILAAGHNAYLLQAMNLFSWRTGDHRYDSIARGIADFLLTLQDSTDGGVFGRPGVAWKSTENNLAAYSALKSCSGS